MAQEDVFTSWSFGMTRRAPLHPVDVPVPISTLVAISIFQATVSLAFGVGVDIHSVPQEPADHT
jgi:hypothetical protein